MLGDTTRISENKIAASKPKRRIGCSVVSAAFLASKQRSRKPADVSHSIFPELLKFDEPIVKSVAGDEAGVDGANRGPNDPVRLHPGLVQRLIHTHLVRAKRPAGLEDENDLSLRACSEVVDCLFDGCV
jgi:hypothetical protein